MAKKIRHRKARRGRRKATMTRAGRSWVARKIRLLMREGKAAKQAVAIALNMARRRGFKVPRKKARR